MDRHLKAFAIIVILCLVMAGMLLLIPATRDYQMHMFFASGRDCLADFLNNLNSLSVSNGFNPYHHWVVDQNEMIYPPFAYAALLPFVRFLPAAGMNIAACHASPLAMAIGWIGTLLMASVLFVASILFSRRYKIPTWLTLLLFCTGMMLSCLERGNQILLSAAGILFFLCYYDASDKRVVLKKTFAAFGLALATSLKVTPVLFGVLWLNRKNIHWLILAGVFTLGMTGIPLLWSDHSIIDNVLQLRANVANNQEIYAQNLITINPQIFLRILMNRLGFPDAIKLPLGEVSRCVVMTLGIACLVRAVICKAPAWKRFFMLAASQVLIPVAPQGYVVLYFTPAILAYFSSDSSDVAEKGSASSLSQLIDRMAFVTFCLFAMPIPLFVFEDWNLNFAVHSMAISLLSLLLVAEPVPHVTETRNR